MCSRDGRQEKNRKYHERKWVVQKIAEKRKKMIITEC